MTQTTATMMDVTIYMDLNAVFGDDPERYDVDEVVSIERYMDRIITEIHEQFPQSTVSIFHENDTLTQVWLADEDEEAEEFICQLIERIHDDMDSWLVTK